MHAILFPGQGSQRRGMFKDEFRKFQDHLNIADRILGYSVEYMCNADTSGKLNKTEYTQPCLFVINALSYLLRKNDRKHEPDFLAGHSLGEYNALMAAGAIDFETGLQLVKKRGELMAGCKAGGMAAIIGTSSFKIEEVLKNSGLLDVNIANYNSPEQYVISGPDSDISRAHTIFSAISGVNSVLLNTSGAFHSSMMKDASIKFADFVKQFGFNAPSIPVISNVSGFPYPNKSIGNLLVDQITSPVRWSESMYFLIDNGVQEFVEVGPGNVLSRLIEKISSVQKTKDVEIPAFSKHDLTEHIPVQKIDTILPVVNDDPGNSPNSAVLAASHFRIDPKDLGDIDFKKDHNLKFAYVAGAMYKGIASVELVVRLAKNGFMGYFGTGGLKIDEVKNAIKQLHYELTENGSFGMNLLSSALEQQLVDLYLASNIKNIEASAYVQITEALVLYRLKGLSLDHETQQIRVLNRIMAKVSRPEVAKMFLSPAPADMVERLLKERKISDKEAELSKLIPMADDICVESDSGGHTDQGVAYVQLPRMLKLRDEYMSLYNYKKKVRIGAAGGIGTPEAAASAFILGADFILTGSINQCTVESGQSEAVKDMLQEMDIQDTDYAPAGDLFEYGSKVQVLRKGVFFPQRANKLYDVYKNNDSIDTIDQGLRLQIEEKYFGKTFASVYEGAKLHFSPKDIERAERNPKLKMAFIFKWYFQYSTRLALDGIVDKKIDFQIQCGPSLGAFNSWVSNTDMHRWQNRHVDVIAKKIMEEAAAILSLRFVKMAKMD